MGNGVVIVPLVHQDEFVLLSPHQQMVEALSLVSLGPSIALVVPLVPALLLVIVIPIPSQPLTSIPLTELDLVSQLTALLLLLLHLIVLKMIPLSVPNCALMCPIVTITMPVLLIFAILDSMELVLINAATKT